MATERFTPSTPSTSVMFPNFSIISDSRFFRNDPELHYIPMINKDGTAFTRKTWMVYHPAELENHLAKNFIEYVKEIDFENF